MVWQLRGSGAVHMLNSSANPRVVDFLYFMISPCFIICGPILYEGAGVTVVVEYGIVIFLYL